MFRQADKLKENQQISSCFKNSILAALLGAMRLHMHAPSRTRLLLVSGSYLLCASSVSADGAMSSIQFQRGICDLYKQGKLHEPQLLHMLHKACKTSAQNEIAGPERMGKASGSTSIAAGAGAPQTQRDPKQGDAKLADAKPEKAPSLIAAIFPDENFRLALAKDFTNIGLMQFSNDAKQATGATISYSDDRTARNSSLTLQAVGTFGYQFISPSKYMPDSDAEVTYPQLTYGLVGVYGGADKFTNSNNVSPKTKTTDNLKYGGVLEIGVSTSGHFSDYFRVRAGSVTNNIAPHTLFKIGKTTVTTTETASQFSGTFEFFPVWNFGSGSIPQEYVGFWGNMQFGDQGIAPVVQINPELVVKYDNTFDSTNPLLFSGKSTATRIGPQLTLTALPLAGIGEFMGLDLYNLNVQATYFYWREVESGRNAYSLSSNLNYPLGFVSGDDIKGVALTVGYRRGSNVDTGQNMGLFSVGISGKFCTYCPIKAGGG